MLDFSTYNNVKKEQRSERTCSVFFDADWHSTEKVNGYVPFFGRKHLDDSNLHFSE